MRRRRFRLAAAVVAALLATAGFGSAACAQVTSTVEGAPQLLFPAGARSIAMGEAAVALSAGAEALWWNPANVSRGPREFTAHIANNFATTDGGADFAASMLFPISGVGALGIGLRYWNSGPSPAEDTTGQIQTGTFEQKSTLVVATFAAPFGDRFSVGVSLKFLQQSYPCTGACDVPTTSPSTGGLDVGAQFIVSRDSSIVFGAAVRNVGPKLQVTDSPQADAQPTRLDIGVAISPRVANWPKEWQVRGGVDLITAVSRAVSPGYRIGAEVGYVNRLYARGGYVVSDPAGSGPTLGFGFSTGRLQIDFAQTRTDVGSLTGKQPTYLSMRYAF